MCGICAVTDGKEIAVIVIGIGIGHIVALGLGTVVFYLRGMLAGSPASLKLFYLAYYPRSFFILFLDKMVPFYQERHRLTALSFLVFSEKKMPIIRLILASYKNV